MRIFMSMYCVVVCRLALLWLFVVVLIEDFDNATGFLFDFVYEFECFVVGFRDSFAGEFFVQALGCSLQGHFFGAHELFDALYFLDILGLVVSLVFVVAVCFELGDFLFPVSEYVYGQIEYFACF